MELQNQLNSLRRLNLADKKTGFWAEFKKFIMRGNVIDMAVGIVIGGAFTAIVTSIVADIINPIVGLVIGKVDFKELRVVLRAATEETAEVAIRYGNVIQNIVSFLLTALVLFLIIRATNMMKEKAEAEKKAAEAKAKAEADKKAAEEAAKKAAEPQPVPADIALLQEIRDLLKKN